MKKEEIALQLVRRLEQEKNACWHERFKKEDIEDIIQVCQNSIMSWAYNRKNKGCYNCVYKRTHDEIKKKGDIPMCCIHCSYAQDLYDKWEDAREAKRIHEKYVRK